MRYLYSAVMKAQLSLSFSLLNLMGSIGMLILS